MSNKNPHLSIDREIMGDIYTSSEPMDNLIVLCDEYGSRFGGTAGEKQAVQFFLERFKAYGLSNVHAESFAYTTWRRGQARFEIISPIEKEIPCISLPHSPATSLEGWIVDMGDGAPDDFDRRANEIEGKIVMTTSVTNPDGSQRWIHRNEKYGRSVMAGATGFIFVNHYPGFGPATGGIGDDGEEGPVPAFSISKENGAFIQRLAKRLGPIKIRISSTDRCEPSTSWNVIADLPGTLEPAPIVMMGSHYDGHDISQGAGDPASGAVAVLEAGRVLAKYASDLPCTVRFVLWGVEEIGLLGSRAYAREHIDEMDAIRFYLNMDSAGTKTNRRDVVLHEWHELAPLFEKWQAEMALDFLVGQAVNAHSDHYPFFLEGAPTGGLGSVVASMEGRGYGHTRYDTVDKVDLKGLREASMMAARLALRIANYQDWPVSRRSKEQVLDILDSQPHYRDELIYADRLKAFLAKNQTA